MRTRRENREENQTNKQKNASTIQCDGTNGCELFLFQSIRRLCRLFLFRFAVCVFYVFFVLINFSVHETVLERADRQTAQRRVDARNDTQKDNEIGLMLADSNSWPNADVGCRSTSVLDLSSSLLVLLPLLLVDARRFVGYFFRKKKNEKKIKQIRRSHNLHVRSSTV